jgi:16S rRNA (uracil1498-N3)-methyltransferase
MRVPRIYTGQTLQVGASVELEAGASQHIARALRMTPGDPLVLFNGRGDEYRAELLTVGKKQVVAAVNERRERQSESTLSLHLGIAISRGDRMDWVVQKATELGVSALTPLFTERTEVKLAGERAEKKLHHWRQIAISACEQCGRNRLPEISGLMDLGSWLDGTEAERKFVLHHRIEAAEEAGFESLALGPRVLRTETAPLAAIAILQARWGDMGLS